MSAPNPPEPATPASPDPVGPAPAHANPAQGKPAHVEPRMKPEHIRSARTSTRGGPPRSRFARLKARLRAPKFGLPRSSNHATITELLLQQIDFSLAAAELAIEVLNRTTTAKVSRAAMREVEHQGDFAKAALSDRIALALTTPLDREDLFRASRAIDDVLDTLRDLVREMDMWKVKPGKWSRGSLAPARQSLTSLRSALANPESERAKIRCIRARKEAGQLRRAYQEGLTGVFAEELTMDTLKKREILRRIDVVGLRLTEAADAVLDGLVKRSL